EPPVASFLELTGGDAALARELELVYEGDVNRVDAGIGILAEPKPAGFALGFAPFYQFVLNAPRRAEGNRLLSEGSNYRPHPQAGSTIPPAVREEVLHGPASVHVRHAGPRRTTDPLCVPCGQSRRDGRPPGVGRVRHLVLVLLSLAVPVVRGHRSERAVDHE